MSKGLRSAFVLAALCALFGAAVAAGARRQGPVVGGYKQAAADAPEVVSAAEFAVAARSRSSKRKVGLRSVESAERQTVAGVNYRLCLKVEEEDTENNVDVTETVRVVVFKSLKNAYTLKSWAAEDCAGEE